MKNTLNLLVGIVFLSTSLIFAQDFEEDFRIEISKDDYNRNSEIFVKNINGSLEVTGYEGDEILITGTKKLQKRRGAISNSERSEYRLESTFRDGNWFIYVDTPYSQVSWRDGRMNYNIRWEGRDRDRVEFEFDIQVKLPKDLFIDASTINSDALHITGMENGVEANHVNGDVVVKDAIGKVDVHTVNGDIEVWFKVSPEEDCDFNTVNGTMEIYSPADFGAIVTFRSLHGELYTDFDEVTRLANQLNKEAHGNGFRYRISRTAPIQIGDGGPQLSFETVNGSAYIRQRKS